jgi:hypothetical protein
MKCLQSSRQALAFCRVPSVDAAHLVMDLKLDTGSFITETVAPTAQEDASPFSAGERGDRVALEDREEGRSLGLWLCALQSFFKLHNHPVSEAEQSAAPSRDWANELRIARRCLLQSAQLALQLCGIKQALGNSSTVLEGAGALSLPGMLAPTEDSAAESPSFATDEAAVTLAEMLSNACAMCEAIAEGRKVSYHAWTGLGKFLGRELESNPLAQRLVRGADFYAAAALPAPLLKLLRDSGLPASERADMMVIFTHLARMLQRLRFIETALRRDQPLKFLLPVFTLLKEEGQSLLEFIETRAMRTEGLDEAVFDTLDGTNYAVSMELRKVFSHELVGLSELRQPTVVYAKVENAHGLLRDCFQQSAVVLAQLFDPTLEGAQLFDTFQTKLQQSLALRRDLWTLLLLVRRAEKERDQRPVAPLLERLRVFREGSLRYLMYKDWEACERFMEEVAAARGAIELSPVLHRFGAYLETLHGQVNMRAVLVNHPFEYPELEA